MNARPGFSLCGVAKVNQIKRAVHAAWPVAGRINPILLKNAVVGLNVFRQAGLVELFISKS